MRWFRNGAVQVYTPVRPTRSPARQQTNRLRLGWWLGNGVCSRRPIENQPTGGRDRAVAFGFGCGRCHSIPELSRRVEWEGAIHGHPWPSMAVDGRSSAAAKTSVVAGGGRSLLASLGATSTKRRSQHRTPQLGQAATTSLPTFCSCCYNQVSSAGFASLQSSSVSIEYSIADHFPPPHR